MRFFSVTLPTGTELNECLARNTFSSFRRGENRKPGFSKIEIKRPVANRLAAPRPARSPPVRIIETVGLKGFLGNRAERTVRRLQDPRLVQQFGNCDPAPPHPRILRANDHRIGIVKQRLESAIEREMRADVFGERRPCSRCRPAQPPSERGGPATSRRVQCDHSTACVHSSPNCYGSMDAKIALYRHGHISIF